MKNFLIKIKNIQDNEVERYEDSAQTVEELFEKSKQKFNKLENTGHTIEVVEI